MHHWFGVVSGPEGSTGQWGGWPHPLLVWEQYSSIRPIVTPSFPTTELHNITINTFFAPYWFLKVNYCNESYPCRVFEKNMPTRSPGGTQPSAQQQPKPSPAQSNPALAQLGPSWACYQGYVKINLTNEPQIDVKFTVLVSCHTQNRKRLSVE